MRNDFCPDVDNVQRARCDKTPPAGRARFANRLPDRFQIDTGYFRMDANTVLRFGGPQGGSGDVDFEEDLGQDPTVDTLWLDGRWRIGRRHQLQLGFTRSHSCGAVRHTRLA